MELLAPAFRLAQLRMLWPPWGVNQQMEDFAPDFSLSITSAFQVSKLKRKKEKVKWAIICTPGARAQRGHAGCCPRKSESGGCSVYLPQVWKRLGAPFPRVPKDLRKIPAQAWPEPQGPCGCGEEAATPVDTHSCPEQGTGQVASTAHAHSAHGAQGTEVVLIMLLKGFAVRFLMGVMADVIS